jgi:hypothetical protein
MRILEIFSVILFTIPPLFADPESKRVEQWLKTDKNDDGVLTIEETTGLMRRFFERNDRDGNGKLTKEELRRLDESLKKNPRSEAQRRRPEAALVEGVTVRKNQVYRSGHDRWKLDVYLPMKKHRKGAALV